MPAVGEEVIDSQQVGFAPYGLLNNDAAALVGGNLTG